MNKPKIHYAGPIQTDTMKILPGWAACCSGFQAEKIAADGNHSYERNEVTCKKCLKQVDKQIEAAEREATAEAWHRAWICRPRGSDAEAHCAAEALIAAEREGTADAWRWACLCQPSGSEAEAQCRARLVGATNDQAQLRTK
jgi:hypothetical protein